MNRTILTTLTILFLLFLASCATNPTGATVQSEKIKIGVSLPATGFASSAGGWVRNGLELAVEHLSEEDRDRLELLYEDDQCNQVKGVNIATKLVEADDIQFVLGPFCAAVITSTMDYYEENKIIRMITGLGTDTFTNTGNYRFVLLGEVKDLTKSLAKYAFSQEIHTMTILYMQDDYGQENADYFEKWFTEEGGKIIATEPFKPGENDYSTQLLKLKSANADGVYIAAIGTSLLQILKQMPELEFAVAKYAVRNMEDTEVIEAGGNLTNGVIFATTDDVVKSDIKDWFARRYKEKYGVIHEAAAANAFDSFNLLFASIKECDQDVECVRKKISETKDYVGASGKFSVNEKNNALRTPTIKVVNDGVFKILK